MPRGLPITPEQVAEALALQKRGWALDRIAESLGVRPDSLSRRLVAIHRKAAERLRENLAAEKGKQIEQLGHVAAEAAEAWERSQGRRVRVRRVGFEEAPGRPVLVERTVESGQGDPRYLLVTLKALADQRKILGLDAPRPKGEDTGPVRVIVEYVAQAPPSAED